MNIIKRNGTEVPFDKAKIIAAVEKANKEVDETRQLSAAQIAAIADNVETDCEKFGNTVGIEQVQDKVITGIQEMRGYEVAQKYIQYRYTRELARKANTTDDAILSLIDRNNEEVKQENSNKNPIINSTQRDYMAGEVSKDLTERVLLPEDIVKAHREGILHFHDEDYFAQLMHNCCLVNLEDMLQNGTVISGHKIDTPQSFATACNVATQIVAQVASSQYGGQTISLAHLAPFVDVSRQKFIKKVKAELQAVGIETTEENIMKIAEMRLKDEIKAGVQTIQYQLVTLMTTNGQTPFVSVFMNIKEVPEGQTRDDLIMVIEEVLKQRIQGVKNEKGVWVTPAFPKLLYVKTDNNTYPGDKYFWLSELAAKCTAKRMVPDYISEKKMKELKNGDVYACMGCRSFLTVDRCSEKFGNIANAGNYREGEHKYYGRFNQGVVTLNLVDIACSSSGDMNKFWEIMDERLELCHRALRCRHERLLGTPSDVAPILWQHGALARLEKGEKIDKLLYGGYSTISLGYAGLYECVKYMTGKSHTDEEAKPFATKVMQALNDACKAWKAAEDIDYSVYGTPLESTTYKFAKALRKRFGIIEGVTDHDYITNSYHVNVREEIDAFTKLSLESEFQELSPGGAISYVEVPNMQNNIDAVIAINQHIYETIMYAEINSKSDYCMCCGYDGEIVIKEDEHKKLYWQCPHCGNTDQDKMSVARRTCGYIGSQYWNQGRTQEIRDRVLHVN